MVASAGDGAGGGGGAAVATATATVIAPLAEAEQFGAQLELAVPGTKASLASTTELESEPRSEGPAQVKAGSRTETHSVGAAVGNELLAQPVKHDTAPSLGLSLETVVDLIKGVAGQIAGMEKLMDVKFKGVDDKFAGVEKHMDVKFKGVDDKFAGVDDKFAGVDNKFACMQKLADSKLAGVEKIATGENNHTDWKLRAVTGVCGAIGGMILAVLGGTVLEPYKTREAPAPKGWFWGRSSPG